MSARVPTIGQWYSVVCPTCYATVTFDCRSLGTYGIQCSACGAIVDLRNANETLEDDDVGQFPKESGQTVMYCAGVEESDGLSASAQVNMVIDSLAKEQQKVMPTRMTGETTQAFSAQRNQALAEKFSCFYPVTHAIEWLIFGNKPDAKVGHVRIFRKKVPFYGYVNFPVPKTTTSYAGPSVYTFTSFMGVLWFQSVMGDSWMQSWMCLEWLLIILFYILLFHLAYSDPGYVRPGYVENSNRTSDELTLKDIEKDQRESKWETVNGVPMERKWCSTCEMYRPVRAAHCYLCGLCCYDHDHHCTVIGVCVGRRKMEAFATFVTVCASAVGLPAVLVMIGLYNSREKLSTTQFYVSIALLLPMVMFTCVLTPTSISIWQSVVFEETTRERLQHVYAAKRNPFNRGYLRNTMYHLFQRKVEPSLFDDDFVRKCAMRYEAKELGTGKTVTCM